MRRRIISIILVVSILFSFGQTAALAAGAARDTAFEETLAEDLKSLGLFKGVSDTDFDLGRAPSRAEALVMLIRVLGKENEALGGNWTHPFTDVVSWANKYVGYAYQNGLTNGVSATQFGTGTASATMYLTFVLRALGYSDAGGADFAWNDPFSLADSVGILPDCVNTNSFLRADVALVSYCALQAALKGSAQTLAQKLIAAGVFTQAQFDAHYDAGAVSDYLSSGGGDTLVELTSEQIYAACSPAVFYMEVYTSAGDLIGSGSGFFIDKSGTAVTNYHVIQGCSSAKITTSDTGKIYDVLGVCDYNIEEDWAVIKINGSGFSYLEFGDPSTVVGGATVYAIGSPNRLQNSITQGLVSNPSRVLDGMTYIQTSAAISHGSSGGALINKYGQVIGITSAGFESGQNLNLAVPVSDVEPKTLTDYIRLSAADVADPFAYLTAFLKKYGTYSETEYITSYYLEESDSDFYTITAYSPETDSLYICCLYGSIDCVYLYLKGPKTAAPEKYYYTYVDMEYSVTADGYLSASAFGEDSTLAFSAFSGAASYKNVYQDIAHTLLLYALYMAQYTFSSYGVLVTIEDFGFTGVYNSIFQS